MGDKGKRLTSPSGSKHRDSTTSIHFESLLQLVDFPLAFAAPTSKHLILITVKRLGSNVVLYVGLVGLKLHVRHKHVARVLQYFVTASLILTSATCQRFHQVSRIWPAGVSRVKCTLSVRENDRIYRRLVA